MSQHSEKYLYFNVGLLKDSLALQALWQDALKYHMIDQPGKLIALRLTEYYDLMARGMLPQGTSAPFSSSSATSNGSREDTRPRPAVNHSGNSRRSDEEPILPASSEADHNAEEAADYWSIL
jgi:hypothetical protein